MIDRSQCTAKRHGRSQDYIKNGCRCPDARVAARSYRKRIKAGLQAAGLIDARGTHRRIRALQAIGWPISEVARRLGYTSKLNASLSPMLTRSLVQRTFAERVDAIYAELCMTPGPSARSRRDAVRKGWVSPLGWDDIDSDDEPTLTNESDGDYYDEEVVQRLMVGRKTPARDEDRTEAARRLISDGLTENAVAFKLGAGIKTVRKLLGEAA